MGQIIPAVQLSGVCGFTLIRCDGLGMQIRRADRKSAGIEIEERDDWGD